ncbi:MAG: hypothetical protein K2G60_02225 [Oscillospiraceae bacterium]|nr:hypothetical protein [Oscillospiraceae bacterium]
MIIIKPKLNFILLTAVIFVGAGLFAFPELTLNGAKKGVEICLNSLIPSLFPFMALSTFIMRTDALYIPCKIFGKVTKILFLLPESVGQIIFMSLIGGYPIGAKLTGDALQRGDITENEAKRLCIFCMNAGPAFTVTVLGVNIYGNAKTGLIIYISLCISSVIIGILTRFLSDGKATVPIHKEKRSFSSDDITFSVWNAFEATMRICAWVILFSAFTVCIITKSGKAGEFINAITEVTAGATVVAKTHPIPVVTALCGFGGFCVHCQILKYLKLCSLPYKIFFAGRLLNSALSAAICYLILYCFPIEQNVAYTFTTARVSPISVSLPAVITFIFMCISMILNIERKEKVC